MGIENENEIMITILNSSHEIQHNKEKAHNELLSMINAAVSHELRNPLNSISAINLQKEMLYNELESIINDPNICNKDKCLKAKKILVKLRNGKNV